MTKRTFVQNIFLTSLLLLSFAPGLALAQQRPYNENQNARADLKMAIEQASRENKHVMVQFGGNWCPWCLKFHALVNGVPKMDSLMKANYVYLLVNVPREKDKRDYDLFDEFGYPNRFGYPVFVILGKDGKRLNTVDSEGFEHRDPNVKGYDTTKVERFLTMWTPAAVSSKTYEKLFK